LNNSYEAYRFHPIRQHSYILVRFVQMRNLPASWAKSKGI